MFAIAVVSLSMSVFVPGLAERAGDDALSMGLPPEMPPTSESSPSSSPPPQAPEPWMSNGTVPELPVFKESTAGNVIFPSPVPPGKSFTVGPPLADLTLDFVTSVPSYVPLGMAVSLRTRAANRGSTPVSATDIAFYDGAVGPTTRIGKAEAMFEGYESSPVTLAWVPTGGSHTVIAVVDPDNRIPESIETNNEMRTSVRTLSGGGIPDIEVNPAKIESLDYPVPGVPTTLRIPVDNGGTGSAPSFNVSVWDGSAEIATVTVPSLGPGANTTVDVEWTPSGRGEMNIKVAADAANVLDEMREDNNVVTVGIPVGIECMPGECYEAPAAAGKECSLTYQSGYRVTGQVLWSRRQVCIYGNLDIYGWLIVEQSSVKMKAKAGQLPGWIRVYRGGRLTTRVIDAGATNIFFSDSSTSNYQFVVEYDPSPNPVIFEDTQVWWTRGDSESGPGGVQIFRPSTRITSSQFLEGKTHGLYLAPGVSLTSAVTGSEFARNGERGIFFDVGSGASLAQDIFANNKYGVYAANPGNAVIDVAGSFFTANTYGLYIENGALPATGTLRLAGNSWTSSSVALTVTKSRIQSPFDPYTVGESFSTNELAARFTEGSGSMSHFTVNTISLTASGIDIVDCDTTLSLSTSTIDGQWLSAVRLYGSSSILTDLTIMSDYYYGVAVGAFGGTTATLQGSNFVIRDVGTGIQVEDSSPMVDGVRILPREGDEISALKAAYVTGASSHPVFSNMYIFNPSGGIHFFGADGEIRGTTIEAALGRVGGQGVYVERPGSDVVIADSTIRYWPWGVYTLGAIILTVERSHFEDQVYPEGVPFPVGLEDRGLLILYGNPGEGVPRGTITDSTFLGNSYGISYDNVGMSGGVMTVEGSTFDSQGKVGIGGGSGAPLAATVRYNTFERMRGAAIIVSAAGQWDISHNTLLDNSGDASEAERGEAHCGAIWLVYLADEVTIAYNDIFRTNDSAVRVDSASPGITIALNNLVDNGIGVWWRNGGTGAITGNEISDGGTGIWVDHGYQETISDNTIRNNDEGIVFFDLTGPYVFDGAGNNLVQSNVKGIVALDITAYPDRNLILQNVGPGRITGNTYGIYVEDSLIEIRNAYIDGGNTYAVWGTRSAILLASSYLVDNYNGIALVSAFRDGPDHIEYSAIIDNTITTTLQGAGIGILADNNGGNPDDPPSDPFVWGNTVSGFDYGMYSHYANLGNAPPQSAARDNTIQYNEVGVYFDGTSSALFKRNLVSHNDYGIVVRSSQPWISENNADSGTGILENAVGIYVSGTSWPTIEHNDISASMDLQGSAVPIGIYATGTTMQQYALLLIRWNNIAYTRPGSDGFIGVRLDHSVAQVSHNTLDAPVWTGGTDSFRTGVYVCEGTCSGTPAPDDQTVIEYNDISGFSRGFYLFGFLHVRLGSLSFPSNTVMDAGQGTIGAYIQGYAPATIEVLNNRFLEDVFDWGTIGIQTSMGLVQGNEIKGHYYGMVLYNTSPVSLTIDRNNVHDNTYGIYAGSKPDGFTATCNDFHDNVKWAIDILSPDVSGAHIHHNNFVGNNGVTPSSPNPGEQAHDDGSGNLWDSPAESIGNYWGTPVEGYVTIPTQGTDHYPSPDPIVCV